MKSPTASSNGIQRFTHLEKIPEHSNMFKAFERATLSPIAIKRNKKFAMSPRNVEKARRLQPILQLVDHPHIAKSIDHLVDQNDMFTILEYVPNSAVAANVVKQRAVTNFINLPVLSAEEISIITRQLLDALRYLHTFPSGPIVCRDITPDNIILTGVGHTISCKLLDFAAAMTEDEVPSNKALEIKRLYTSPEQYRVLEGLALADDVIDTASDMWNLGATLLDLATGMKLIEMTESSLQALRYGYTDWSFEQDVLSAMSEDQYFLWCRQEEFVRLVIARTLRVHMKARPSAAEMLQLDDVLHARMQKTKRKGKSKKAKDPEPFVEQPSESQRLFTPSPMRQRRLQTPSRTKPSAVKARSSSVRKTVTIAPSIIADDQAAAAVVDQPAQALPPSRYEDLPHDSNSLASIIVSDSVLNASHVIPMSTTLVLSSPTVPSPSISDTLQGQQSSPDGDTVDAAHPVLKRSNSPVSSPNARSVRQKLGFQSVDVETRTTIAPPRSPVPTVDVAAMARRMVTADSLSSISTADALHQIARALSTYSDSQQVKPVGDSTTIAALSATTTLETAASALTSPVSGRCQENHRGVSSGRSPRATLVSPYSSRTASTIAAIAETLVQVPSTIESDASSVDSIDGKSVSSDNTLPTTEDSLSIDLQTMTLSLPLQPSSLPTSHSNHASSATSEEQVGGIRIAREDVAYSPQGYRVYRQEHLLALPCTRSSVNRTVMVERSFPNVPVAWLIVPHPTIRSLVTLLAMVNVAEPSTVEVWEFITASDDRVTQMKVSHRGSLRTENGEVTSLLRLTTMGSLCSGYADGSVRLWDVSPLVLGNGSDDDSVAEAVGIHHLPVDDASMGGSHETAVRCMLQSSWYGRLVVGRGNGTISVWSLAGQQPLFELGQHQAAVTAVVEISDVRIVSASEDGTLRLWHLEQRQCLHVFRGHLGGLSSVALWATASRQYLLSGGKDETLRVWDVDGRRGIGIVKHQHASTAAGGGGVLSMAWIESSRGEDLLAVSGADGQISLWSPSLLLSSLGFSVDSSACIQRIPSPSTWSTRQPLPLPTTLVASIDGSSASVRTVLGESNVIHHSGPLAIVAINDNSPVNPGLAVWT